MNSASCAHAQPYASLPSNAGLAEPALPSSVLTGYLFCHGKAFDLYTTAQIQEVLQNLKINMEGPPPFKTVTEDAGYASHGVIRINNVSSHSSTGTLREQGRGRRPESLSRSAQDFQSWELINLIDSLHCDWSRNHSIHLALLSHTHARGT